MDKHQLMGIDISCQTEMEDVLSHIDMHLDHPQGTASVISFVNPHSYWLVSKRPEYLAYLSDCDLVLCDGIGVVVAARILGLQGVTRISFDTTSLAPYVFELCKAKGAKLFLIGGVDGVADKASRIIMERWGVCVVGCAHGFYKDYSAVFDEITKSDASVVVCGMGAPHQERVLLDLRSHGWRGVALTCGGFLDQLCVSGGDYYPAWVNKYNVRFMYRIYKEPTRLFRRYFFEYRVFVYLFLKSLLGVRR